MMEDGNKAVRSLGRLLRPKGVTQHPFTEVVYVCPVMFVNSFTAGAEDAQIVMYIQFM